MMGGKLFASLVLSGNTDAVDVVDLQLIPVPPTMCRRIYKSVPGDGTSLQEQMCMEDCGDIFSDILVSTSHLPALVTPVLTLPYSASYAPPVSPTASISMSRMAGKTLLSCSS